LSNSPRPRRATKGAGRLFEPVASIARYSDKIVSGVRASQRLFGGGVRIRQGRRSLAYGPQLSMIDSSPERVRSGAGRLEEVQGCIRSKCT